MAAPHGRLQRVASVALLGTPVAFGVIRALTTGNDLRYLWLAAAAILGSMAVAFAGGTAAGGPIPGGRTLFSVVAGAAGATAVALLMGTKAGPGIAVVALSFGLCTGAGAVLAARTRQRPRP